MKLRIKKSNTKFVCFSIFSIVAACLVFCFFAGQKETNPLELLEEAPERLVVLKGKLIFKLFPGPPEYSSIEGGDRADYCWILRLESPSLHLALATSVLELASRLEGIENRSNYDNVFLSLDEGMEKFCYEHRDQHVTVEGYLFGAHTVHHYTSILMDVKKIL